jgi:hypothetical protein
MIAPPDHYEVYYADKLWGLLPTVYRAEDTDQFGANGPLREMVNRIGAQAAILRRSIDRMWEDQSIETCDDWLIPYIGALLGVKLVSGLDARGQRLDVAKTIYYRRRKGTLAILEEIAANITGWDAKVVEFFRRLGRTRHSLDPPIGQASAGPEIASLQLAEGLIGRLTSTGIGGWADLRDVYGATKAHSAFDEFFHTADFRQGRGRFGWYGIPRLGVFLWRLLGLHTGPVAPVPVQACPGWFTFDPTGRDVPLFGQARPSNAFGDAWVSPTETQLPTPISQTLLDNDLTATPSLLYPAALSVAQFLTPPLEINTLAASSVTIRPERGRFHLPTGSPPLPGEIVASYCYGFPSEIGAGPYDRRIDTLTIGTPAPAVSHSGGSTVPVALPGSGTVTFTDSLTYAGIGDVTLDQTLTLRAGNLQRPLIRLPQVPVTLTGMPGSSLSLDGIFLSGGDVVLQGSFDAVTLSCCTLDPGSEAAGTGASASPPAAPFAIAADGRPLLPTRLWIEARIKTLTADRCVLGPIRTRGTGLVETLSISNSIVQSIPTSAGPAITPEDVKASVRFEQLLQQGTDSVSAWLRLLSPEIGGLLGGASSPPFSSSPPPESDLAALLGLLNQLIAEPSIYDAAAFAQVRLSARTSALLAEARSMLPAPALNRALLDDAYRLELADAALALADGTVTLSRCTILGQFAVHRLQASECILQQLAQVDDIQHGCVRFTAWADGSALPRQFESVRIPQGAALFTSTDFGQPGYGQLLPLADNAILPPATPTGLPLNTISEGAVDGSEMGAYARDKNPIKARALLIKFQEYMPAGLVPVPITVT